MKIQVAKVDTQTASHLIQNGATVPVVSRLLGHANIATTHRYAAVWEGDRRRAVDTLKLA